MIAISDCISLAKSWLREGILAVASPSNYEQSRSLKAVEYC